VDFKTGARLRVYSYSAQIKDGQVSMGFGIGVRYQPANSTEDTQECGLGVNDAAGKWVLAQGVKRPDYKFDNADSGDNSAAKDEAFKTAAREALNQVMGHVITENSEL